LELAALLSEAKAAAWAGPELIEIDSHSLKAA